MAYNARSIVESIDETEVATPLGHTVLYGDCDWRLTRRRRLKLSTTQRIKECRQMLRLVLLAAPLLRCCCCYSYWRQATPHRRTNRDGRWKIHLSEISWNF